MARASSSSALWKTGEAMLGGGSPAATDKAATMPAPVVPKYLSVHALTKRRKLPASTGNLHGYLAEDYHQLSWPLPKMFGEEKYGHSLIDITDSRHLKECAFMSKKLVRLTYDQQIVDLEWRKTYKALLDAEHRLATLSSNAPQKARDALKAEVTSHNKYLLEMQEQKDLYETEIGVVSNRCDEIKLALKKERDLEELRVHMEGRTRKSMESDTAFWSSKFNIYREARRR